jgi:CTD small phosphatase-like protein 2
LFSPGLRTDSHDKRNDSLDKDHHIHSVTTDHYKLELEVDHSESPAEEIKQHTLDDSVDMEEEDPDVFNPYHFIAFLPDHHTVAVREKLCLPAPKSSRATLVLDLDETLVHCTVEPVPKPDLIFPVE